MRVCDMCTCTCAMLTFFDDTMPFLKENRILPNLITAVGLRLSDEAIRVAVAHRLGSKACDPHTCVCGKAVDARGLHGLSCRRRAPRQQRHSLWHPLESNQASSNASSQSADQPDAGWQQTPRWDHYPAMGQKKANGLGRDSTRHIIMLSLTLATQQLNQGQQPKRQHWTR